MKGQEYNDSAQTGDSFRSKVFIGLIVIGIGVYLTHANLGKLSDWFNRDFFPAFEGDFNEIIRSFDSKGKEVISIMPGDNDQDGLSNVLEAFLKSDPEVIDTDGDGYSDYEEFLSYHDPILPNATINDQYIAVLNEDFLKRYFINNVDLVVEPDLLSYYYDQLGKGLREKGDFLDAGTAFEKSLDYGLNSDVYFSACFIYLNLNMTDKVKPIIDRYKKDFPQDWGAYYVHARYLEKIRQDELAEENYLVALSYNPDYHQLYVNYGVNIMDRGRYEESIPYFERAISINPNNPVAYHNLGVAYERLGRIPLAEENFAKSQELQNEGFKFDSVEE